VPALGRDTESALLAGVVTGLRGAARELAARVAAEADLRAPLCVVSGGARALLLDPPGLFAGAWSAGLVEDQDLVHRGLRAALLAGPAP
jgi:pantothenate kinase type III